jgi:hypothetical protein
MATQAAIDAVKLQLPDLAETSLSIDDDVISGQIDSVGQTKSILFFLRAIAAKVAPIEDVTESGSSRTMQFHTRLMAMITDWQARADAEDAAAGNLPVKQHAHLRTAHRVDLIWPSRT